MFWTYLLLSDHGEVYTGQTSHLRNRLRSHNAEGGQQWTSGRRWHYVAVRRFETRGEAMALEFELKNDGRAKKRWLAESLPRILKIMDRYGFPPPRQLMLGPQPKSNWGRRRGRGGKNAC